MDYRRRAEHLGKIEAELRREMASSLGRVGRRLEERLETLARLHRELSSSKDDERTRRAREFNEVRRLAERDLWFLRVQREAMGLRSHQDLERIYPIPRAVHL
jgi:hypothetical protein